MTEYPYQETDQQLANRMFGAGTALATHYGTARARRIAAERPECEAINTADRGDLIHEVVRYAAHIWQCEPGLVYSQERTAAVVRVRNTVYLVAHHELGMGWSDIGRALKRNHTSTLRGERNARDAVTRDPLFAARVNAVKGFVRKLTDTE